MNVIEKIFFENCWECKYRKKGEKKFNTIRTSKRFWCADPFLAQDDEDYYIFYEIMDRKKSRGMIGISRLNKDSDSHIDSIIDLGCHVSYPNVFKYKNDWYLVPETVDRESIELYKAKKFPYEWEKKSTLISGIKAVDSTIIIKNNKLYLFIYEIEGNQYALSIGEIDIDSGNIIDKKVVATYTEKVGRPAGNIILTDSKIIRPTQYGVNHYGEKIVFKKISLDLGYTETDVYSINAQDIMDSKKAIGIHTYNSSGEYEVFDVLYHKFLPFRPIELLMKKFQIGGFCFYER